jgi:uncharacterized protein DUF3667
VTEPAANAWATTCRNCGTSLTDKFCPHCGQRAIPPRPTVHELAGDAWQEIVGWDGKFLRTVRLLLGRPGELTVAVLEGRRARYVSPVRLYLICSLCYFLIAGAVPVPETTVSFDVGVGVAAEESDPVDAVFAKVIARGLGSLTGEERALLEAEIARTPAIMRPIMRSLVTDYAGLQRRVLETLPQALFVLIPVLALVIGWFNRGRHFPEHLYTALHLQSVVFLALAAVTLTNLLQSFVAFSIAMATALILIVGYAVIAQRRVYGGSWGMSAVKAFCVAVVYWALWAVTSFGVSLWVAAI